MARIKVRSTKTDHDQDGHKEPKSQLSQSIFQYDRHQGGSEVLSRIVDKFKVVGGRNLHYLNFAEGSESQSDQC